MASILDQLAGCRFVPVLRANDAERALRAALALAEGGCRAIEVTMTVPDAPAVMRALAGRGLLVGAGTVLTEAEAEAAIAAGAAFLVSPVLAPAVMARATALGALFIPGALTPGEVHAATAAGAEVVKIFPAESMGGPRYLKLLADPLPGGRYFPTGGVTLENASAYLEAGAVAVGVGSALAPQAAIAAGDTARLTALARAWRERLG